MMNVKEFQERLKDIFELAKGQDNNLNHDDILKCFGENQLSTEQLKNLYEYLRLQGIRIGGTVLEQIDLEEQGDTSQGPAAELTQEDLTCLEEYEAYVRSMDEEREGEKEVLLEKLAGGNTFVWERLSQLYLPVILNIAREMYQEGFFIGDLIQEGNMALLSVAVEEMPEEERGLWMEQRIKDGIKCWVDGQREQKFQDEYLVEKVRKLEAAIREISDDEEQKFSVEELSAYLDMDEEEIRSVLSLTSEGSEEDKEDQ